MTIETQKLNLVSKILSIDNPSVIDLIGKVIYRIEKLNAAPLNDISFYIGNIEPKVDIEKLKEEQGVRSLSLQELDQLILEADFTEDIDELLETLN